MNCCERTLVTLACVAGMSKESHYADINSATRVIEAAARIPMCSECAPTFDVLISVIHVDASIKVAVEQIAIEYVRTLGRCAE